MKKFNEIKAAVKAVVDAVQYNGENPFVDVFTHGTNDFSGYPSVTIINAEINSEYHTTTQNLRTYVVYCYIYMNLEQTSQPEAWDILTDLQEVIIDALDHTENFDGTTDFIRPSAVQPVETNAGEGGKLLVAPIRIECAWSFYFK